MSNSFGITRLSAIILATTLVAGNGVAQQKDQSPVLQLSALGKVLIPESSVEPREEAGKGVKAYTGHILLLPTDMPAGVEDYVGPAPSGETPASIAAVYKLQPGGGATIGIVDAFDYPTAEADLETFSQTFGLPLCNSFNGCFKKVYAEGTVPSMNRAWSLEACLDIEWAHAMAPNARIVLVEAADNSIMGLMKAVAVANEIVSPHGQGFGEISMSFGASEWPLEGLYDGFFTQPGVVYIAGSGDVGGKTNYPSTSPNVIAAGGTSIQRTLITAGVPNPSGQFLKEIGWAGSGGGSSSYVTRPEYQNSIVSIVGTQRGVPDVSFDANPFSGVSIYTTTSYRGFSGWLVLGGTSVAAPSIAGIINTEGHYYNSTEIELDHIYSELGTGSLRDIVVGKAGKFTATTGWDFVTGVGVKVGVSGGSSNSNSSGGGNGNNPGGCHRRGTCGSY